MSKTVYVAYTCPMFCDDDRGLGLSLTSERLRDAIPLGFFASPQSFEDAILTRYPSFNKELSYETEIVGHSGDDCLTIEHRKIVYTEKRYGQQWHLVEHTVI